MRVYIAFDKSATGTSKWGLAIKVDPPTGSKFRRYDLEGPEVSPGIAKADQLVKTYASQRKTWDEVQLPDSLV